MDDDINQGLNSMSEFQHEMRQWWRQMREEAQLLKQDMRENTDRMVNTMNKLFGTLTEEVIEIRDIVKSIDQRLVNVEHKITEFTEFVDFDRRLRVLEDIILKKAS